MKSRLVIGSRGSMLALIQSEWVSAKILLANPGVDVQVEVIKTTGDVSTKPLSVIGGKGVFTKELEDALLDCGIDVAVHSLKDLPTTLPAGLVIAAICERQDPSDALVLPLESDTNHPSLEQLAARAVVGTSSLRRLAQLKHLRSDLVIKDLRGNVDTRLRKLDEGQYDALILASAGLRRLGLTNRISAAISSEQMLPAVGQGAIAIETRDGDPALRDLVSALDHGATRLACTAERAMLKALGGGCQLPIAAHAVVCGQELRLDGLVAGSSGNRIIRNHINGPCAEAERLGMELGAQLLKQGAGSLLNSQ